MPILIVSTTGERESAVRDDSDNKTNLTPPHLSDVILSSICTFHGVQPENIVILSSRSSAPMADVAVVGELNKAVYDWVDNL